MRLLSALAVLILGLAIEGAFAQTYLPANQNVTENSWMYFQGYMRDTRIYQTDPGYAGQKMAVGMSGTGTVSRNIHSEVNGGTQYDEISYNEDVVADYRPYTPPLTQSDLKNALCAKNYAVGSQISESYSNIQQIIKDTNIYQDDQVSVYQIKSDVSGTAVIGARAQKGPYNVPAYVMSGTYIGNLNIDETLEIGNSSILTLPCP